MTTNNDHSAVTPDTDKVWGTLNIQKVWIPVIIGIGAILYLLANDEDFSWAKFQLIHQADWRYILAAILAVCIRDAGYIYRLRVLTHRDLSWVSGFYVIILWEFASAVTPSVGGGGLVAIFLLLKEGISLGRSLAYIVITSIFDNLFFLATSSLGFLGTYNAVFIKLSSLSNTVLASSLKFIFWFSYAVVFTYTTVMLWAIFIHPKLFQWILLRITDIRFLQRWKPYARKHGEELLLASKVLQQESHWYWCWIGCITLITWSARYLVINMIMAAYVSISLTDHLFILGKQIVMWTIMLVSPTPGSSGTAEFLYKKFHEATLGDYTLITNVLWRLLTYYLYLILGTIYLPRWVRKVFAKKQLYATTSKIEP